MSNAGCLAKENNDENKDTCPPPAGVAFILIDCVVLFTKDYFLLSAKPLAAKNALWINIRDSHKKYLGLIRGSYKYSTEILSFKCSGLFEG